MRGLKHVASMCVGAAMLCGCTKPASEPATDAAATPASAESGHSHGNGPNGGVVFDLGSDHAEFTVDHSRTECQILILDADHAPKPVAAEEFVVSIKETRTADGTPVAPMTIFLRPVSPADGKAARFVGADPGFSHVADFEGVVSGEIDGKPALGEFKE